MEVSEIQRELIAIKRENTHRQVSAKSIGSERNFDAIASEKAKFAEPTELGLGSVILPTLNELQSSLIEFLAHINNGGSRLEPEISEPLIVVLQDEIDRINAAIVTKLRK